MSSKASVTVMSGLDKEMARCACTTARDRAASPDVLTAPILCSSCASSSRSTCPARTSPTAFRRPPPPHARRHRARPASAAAADTIAAVSYFICATLRRG
eukprot:6176790-Pleurochrysis_carterae.AAC.1